VANSGILLFASIVNTLFSIRFMSKDGVELEKTLSKAMLLSLATSAQCLRVPLQLKMLVVLFFLVKWIF
jgi:hypothetical protein